MTLLELQKTFARLLADLIIFAFDNGYGVTMGEAHRPPETARLYAKQGRGIVSSLHCLRLAIDLLLYKDTIYLTDSASYETLGVFWESLSTNEYQCCWGGRFKDVKGRPKPDGGHFSIAFNGSK